MVVVAVAVVVGGEVGGGGGEWVQIWPKSLPGPLLIGEKFSSSALTSPTTKVKGGGVKMAELLSLKEYPFTFNRKKRRKHTHTHTHIWARLFKTNDIVS